MKYIGETGGMYGGRNETGFFHNGDAYLYDYNIFNIFDTDMNNLPAFFEIIHCLLKCCVVK